MQEQQNEEEDRQERKKTVKNFKKTPGKNKGNTVAGSGGADAWRQVITWKIHSNTPRYTHTDSYTYTLATFMSRNT